MPNPLVPFVTPDGCRGLFVTYPLAMARHAAQLPPLVHAGITYVPFTGRLRRDADGQGGVYTMEYRALREVA